MPTSHIRSKIASASTLVWCSTLTALLLLYADVALSQAPPTPANKHALLEYQGDRLIKLSVTGAWPVQQIVTRLRREYGWAVDVEQAPQSPALLRRGDDGKFSPIMRSIATIFPRPADQSATEEKAALDGLAKGLSELGEPVEIMQNGGGRRYDLIPKTDAPSPPLSAVIKLPIKTRSVGETVSDILEQVRAVTGQPLVEGGMVDSALYQVQVTVGGELPARILLAQALDALTYVNVWSLTFDPHEETYAFALDTVVRETRSESGTIVVTPVKVSNKSL